MGWRSAWLLGWAFVACSAAAPLQGPGGRCFVVGDCALGLACVTQTDQIRRCSSDLSGIVSIEEAGAPPHRAMSDAGQGMDVGVSAEAAVLPPAEDAESDTGGDATDDAARE